MSSFVAEFGQDIDESAEKLEQILNILDESYEQISSVCTTLETDSEHLNEIAESVDTSLSNLVGALQNSGDTLETDQQEIVSACDVLQQKTSEAEAKLNYSTQSIEETYSNFTSEVNDSRGQLDSNLEETKVTFTEVQDTFSQLEDEILQTKDTTLQHFVDFISALSQIQENTTTLEAELEANFEQINSGIEATHETNLVALLEDFSEELKQNQMTEMTENFGNFETSLTEAYNNFSNETEGIAHQFIEQNSEMILNVGNYCQDSLRSDLQDTFNDAVENAAQDMAEEVGEQVIMMGVGASVTGTLAPILPLLVIAKKTTGLLKGIFTFGFG